MFGFLHDHEMPGIYTNEEFKEELRLSEANGFISHEEALMGIRKIKWSKRAVSNFTETLM